MITPIFGKFNQLIRFRYMINHQSS